jgi:hypothetical protein
VEAMALPAATSIAANISLKFVLMNCVLLHSYYVFLRMDVARKGGEFCKSS